MEIEKMTHAEVESRMEALTAEIENAESVEAVAELRKEAEALNWRNLAIIEEQKAEERKAAEIANSANVTVVDTMRNEVEKMEMRNTPEYLAAFKRGIMKRDMSECRSLLTENAENGTVALPDFVAEMIEAAWNDDEIMSRVRRTYFKGNYTQMFELSSDGAVTHAEGDVAPAEENLVIGKVVIVAETLKKWIGVSTETIDSTPREFIEFLYDEFRYKIVELAADKVVTAIVANANDVTGTVPAVYKLSENLNAATVINAEAHLEGAVRPVAIMTRATYAALKALQVTSGQNVGDVFDGLTPVFVPNNVLKAYAANGTDPYMIVGDLSGVVCNYPNGDDVKFVYDEFTLAPEDVVRIVGRLLMGTAVVRPHAFTVVYPAA